jgi:hypothetical protein
VPRQAGTLLELMADGASVSHESHVSCRELGMKNERPNLQKFYVNEFSPCDELLEEYDQTFDDWDSDETYAKDEDVEDDEDDDCFEEDNGRPWEEAKSNLHIPWSWSSCWWLWEALHLLGLKGTYGQGDEDNL